MPVAAEAAVVRTTAGNSANYSSNDNSFETHLYNRCTLPDEDLDRKEKPDARRLDHCLNFNYFQGTYRGGILITLNVRTAAGFQLL